MSKFTKTALAEALKELLSTKPLDKITVKDLVEKCQVNRQTFYYHFQDIYDLLGWIYKTEAVGAIRDNRSFDSWQQGLLIIMTYVETHKMLCINTYKSLGKEHLEAFLNQVLFELLGGVMDEVAQDHPLGTDDRQFIVRFYSHAFTGVLLDWIKEGLKIPAQVQADNIIRLMEGHFSEAVDRF